MYDLMGKIVAMIRRTRPRMKVPFFVARVMAWSLDMLQAGTFGLVSNGTLTRDQLKSLTRDNVVADDARTFADLGIEPTAMDAVLPDYLWVYRPGGQYSDAQESASRMRIDRA